ENAYASNRSPLAVRRPWKPGPYQDAVAISPLLAVAGGAGGGGTPRCAAQPRANASDTTSASRCSEERIEDVLQAVAEVLRAALDALEDGLEKRLDVAALIVADQPERRLARGPEAAVRERVAARDARDVDARDLLPEARIDRI